MGHPSYSSQLLARVVENGGMSGPTTRAAAYETKAWTASPVLAWTVRVAIVALPILIAWIAVRFLSSSFYRPDGFGGLLLWILQAITVGSAVSLLTERVTRRFVPLAALLNMSLVFPDESPSRFGVALRAGTIRKQRERLKSIQENGLGVSESEAAAEAIHLVAMLGQHDRLTRGHTERVRAYADLIAQEMGLSQDDRDKLAWGSMLHDVGKMMVPAEILTKDTKPSQEEWTILQGHPAAGGELLQPLTEWLGPWVKAASEHHERWDGMGYPLGLSGSKISAAGRITAVADAFDVMTSRRSYKAPIPAEEAREELVRSSGTQFDPNVVRALLNVSVGKKVRFGPLAWLAELPGVASGTTAIPGAMATTGVVAGSMAIGALGMTPPPESLAFNEAPTTIVSTVESVTTVPVQSSTSSSNPSSTTEQTLPSSTTEASATSVTTGADTTSQPPEESTTTTSVPSSQPTTSQSSTTITTQPTTTSQATTTTGATTTTMDSSELIVVDDAATLMTHEGTRLYVLDNDTAGDSGFDLDTLEITLEPIHALVTGAHDNHLHYKSTPGYVGRDYLEYRICNNAGQCLTGSLDITVTS